MPLNTTCLELNVLKVSFFATNSDEVATNGWKVVDDNIQIIWDEDKVIQSMVSGKGCGCKGIKCDGTTAGCLNCYKSCKTLHYEMQM